MPAEFYPEDRRAWRHWLEKNHRSEKNVWLVIANATDTASGIRYEDAVEAIRAAQLWRRQLGTFHAEHPIKGGLEVVQT